MTPRSPSAAMTSAAVIPGPGPDGGDGGRSPGVGRRGLHTQAADTGPHLPAQGPVAGIGGVEALVLQAAQGHVHGVEQVDRRRVGRPALPPAAGVGAQIPVHAGSLEAAARSSRRAEPARIPRPGGAARAFWDDDATASSPHPASWIGAPPSELTASTRINVSGEARRAAAARARMSARAPVDVSQWVNSRTR